MLRYDVIFLHVIQLKANLFLLNIKRSIIYTIIGNIGIVYDYI